MDQLRQVFTFRFWIVFGLVLLLGTAGWWMGTGSLKAEIDARRATLDSLNVTSGSGAPNDRWIAGLANVADEEEAKLREAATFLWNQQKDVMVWPPEIAPLLAGVEPGDEIPQEALDDYPAEYAKLVEETWKIVQPFDEFEETGEVYLPYTPPTGPTLAGGGSTDRLPFEDPSQWYEFTPSSKEVWTAQEDLWLIRSILTSIREFNDKYGGDSIRNVKLREVVELQLMGGNPNALEAADLGDYGAYSEEFGGDEFFGGEGVSTRSSGGNIAKQDVDFGMEEEIGPATADAALDPSGGGFDESGAFLDTTRRYVDDNESEPFKTRGFYIKVVMDHRYLPEFIVELSNSPFPVQILRVHQAERNETGLDSATPGGIRGGRGTSRQPRQRRDFGLENVESALLDASMAEVAIGGLLTIYRPPPEDMRETEETPAPPAGEGDETPVGETAAVFRDRDERAG